MAHEIPEGTVTVLFTDCEGSTDLATRLGDDAAREVLRACDELVRQQVTRHRGQEVKHTGDGLMVAFTSARRAVACAVDIQRAIAGRNRQDPERAVRVRIGLNTGEVIREETDLFGATVNAAARIADHADAGEILISETAKGVLGEATKVELEDRGEVELKGFPRPMRLHRVSWEEEAIGPAGLRLPERTPFVGREAERAELRRCLDQVTRGRGALVLIGGEPGVGKTRLAEELLLEARQRGVLALTGHCYEMEGAPPYIPFVETLEGTARIVPGEAFREALGDAAPEVAKLMPELRRLFPDIPPPLELPPEQERRYLFNSFQEFLERAARVQPILLVLDDLHWADDSTLLLMQHIAQQVSQMPLMILGTYRDVELDVGHPLARALEELLRQRLAHRIALRRLPEAGVAAMLEALSGQEPPASLVQAVYGETEGNPFFVEEVFQHLAEEGKLFDAQGRWHPGLRVSELNVPEGVRLVIGRRLERVCEDCRRVLTVAAVIGRSFSFELLDALGDVGTDALLDAIDEAERAHLITSTADGPEARFSFAHELIRQTLVSSLSLPRRQRRHLRVAEAMERLYARTLEEHATDLAHHFYQAGAAADPEKTARYLTVAGKRAMEAAAFEDALRHYDDALSLQPADDQRGRADLLYKRGLALRSLGRWEEAMADWREALAAYDELGNAEAAGHVSFALALQLAYSGKLAESLEIGRRGLAALGERVSADRCRLLAHTGSHLSLSGDYSAGASLLDEALTMAETLGDQRLLGQVLGYKTVHHGWHLQPLDAVNAGLRAADILRQTGDLGSLTDISWNTQYALLYLGRLTEAAEIGREVEPLATRLGYLGALLSVRRGIVNGQFMVTGDIKRFEEYAKADLELCRRTGSNAISNAYTYLGDVHFWRGEWGQALAQYQEAANLEPPGVLAGYDWGALFLGEAYVGDRDSAFAVLEQSREKLPRPGRANVIGAWAMLFAAVEGLTVLGEREKAAKLYPLVLEAVDTGAVVLWYSPLLHAVAGMAAAAGEHWEKAEEHYQTALRQAHELPHVIQQPEVRRWYARMLIDRDAPGDCEKARELLTEAIAMYRRIGMPKHVEMAEALLARP